MYFLMFEIKFIICTMFSEFCINHIRIIKWLIAIFYKRCVNYSNVYMQYIDF